VLVAGVGIAWLVKRRSPAMPGLSAWQGVLAEKHGEIRAQWLAEQSRQRYASLLVESPLPDNPILRRHVTENILPGLALYQVLLQEYGDNRQAEANVFGSFDNIYAGEGNYLRKEG
jgi:hypothetical protein